MFIRLKRKQTVEQNRPHAASQKQGAVSAAQRDGRGSGLFSLMQNRNSGHTASSTEEENLYTLIN